MSEYAEGSFGEFALWLLPKRIASQPLTEVAAHLWWPPDFFAVVASLLERSGGYVEIVGLPGTVADVGYRRGVEAVGEEWFNNVEHYQDRPDSIFVVPDRLNDWWLEATKQFGLLVRGESKERVQDRRNLHLNLLRILAAADVASSGFGLSHDSDRAQQWALSHAKACLAGVSGAPTTLCREIHALKARVLPKQHTPRRGLTLRSLSHNLALCPNNAVSPVWWDSQVGPLQDYRSLNILVLPWPTKISTGSFRVTKGSRSEDLAKGFAYFDFHRPPDPAFKEKLKRAHRAALKHASSVDMIVFPELALEPTTEVPIARDFARRHNCVLVGGSWGQDPVVNNALITAPGLGASEIEVTQAKHHRWCLDEGQIRAYGLSGVLPPHACYWEETTIEQRELNFVCLGERLTLSVLICEDLARQDPVYEMLRSVGPNLVIALLMDGPQLRQRWSARYATVLADDPGSSVLSITSLGMSLRSAPRAGSVDRRRVVGLWHDFHNGTARELELDEDCEAGLLTLVEHGSEEYSADGRGDGGAAYSPVFAGFRSLNCCSGSAD